MKGSVALIGPIERDLRARLREAFVPTPRVVGDLPMNAALWLASRAGVATTTAFLGLPDADTEIDAGRLAEAPYLASIGYWVAAGHAGRVDKDAAEAALRRIQRRGAHNLEKTGFADDPLVLVGLHLLAEEIIVDDGNAASDDGGEETSALPQRFLQEAVDEVQTVALALLLASRAPGATPPRSLVFDGTRAADLACLVLAHRTEPELARLLSRDVSVASAERRLSKLAERDTSIPSDRFEGLVLLAALEALDTGARPGVACVTRRAPIRRREVGKRAPESLMDVGIVVALKEEFRELHKELGDAFTVEEVDGQHYYVFSPRHEGAAPEYRCVATYIGEMGPSRAAIVAEKLIQHWQPATVVSLGIAAGIHEDVKVGDVVVASQIDNYLDSGKAVDGTAGFEIKRSGDSFQADHVLLGRVRNLEFKHAAIYGKWRELAQQRQAALGLPMKTLLAGGLVRELPETCEAHLASGPLVGASAQFVAWLKAGDRAYKALEMEAGGLAITAHMSSGRTKALAIRGLSDYGDARKAQLDAVGAGALRRYAMGSAISFLWALLEAEALPRTSPAPARPNARSELPAGTLGTPGVPAVSSEVIDALAKCFNDRESVRMVAFHANLDSVLPDLASTAPRTFWTNVCVDLANGLVEDGLQRLLDAAHKLFPGNAVLKAAAKGGS